VFAGNASVTMSDRVQKLFSLRPRSVCCSRQGSMGSGNRKRVNNNKKKKRLWSNVRVRKIFFLPPHCRSDRSAARVQLMRTCGGGRRWFSRKLKNVWGDGVSFESKLFENINKTFFCGTKCLEKSEEKQNVQLKRYINSQFFFFQNLWGFFSFLQIYILKHTEVCGNMNTIILFISPLQYTRNKSVKIIFRMNSYKRIITADNR
jgi:hypothetical protein